MMDHNSKDQMHPEDIRNLIIFGVLSLAIWFLYDTFILAPQTKAMREARLEQAQTQGQVDANTPFLAETMEVIDRDEAVSKATRLYFENGEITGSIKLQGGRIDDVSLNNYFKTIEKKEKVSILNPVLAKDTRFVDFGWVSGDRSISLPNSSSLWSVQGNVKLTQESPVTLVWDNGQGIRFERELSIDDRYMFHMTQKVINKSQKDLSLHPYALVSQVGIPTDPGTRKTWVSYEGPLGYIGGALEQVSYKKLRKDGLPKKLEADRGWISFSDKYWLTALIPEQGSPTKFRFKLTSDSGDSEYNKYQVDYTASEIHIPKGQSIQYKQRIYVGVKKILTLEDYEEKQGIDQFDLAVDFGWFWFFTYPFFLLLHNLGLLFGNMGFAIIVQTIILRMAVFPLTSFSYRSFAKMKKVAPQIEELRNKHRGDKEKLQAEIVELYQREGVNPMSGCLPIFIQIPLFFAFYKILFTTIEIRHAPFMGWIHDLSAADPTSIFNLFGLLDIDVSIYPQIGVWPCLMLLATLAQKRLNPPPQDKMQRTMMNIFPFFITYIMAKFASGLVVYWTFSATISVLQQMFIMHRMGVPIYIFQKDKSEQQLDKKLDEGAPGVHPLVDMAGEEVEKSLFGEGEKAALPKKMKPPKPKKKKKKK